MWKTTRHKQKLEAESFVWILFLVDREDKIEANVVKREVNKLNQIEIKMRKSK